jgi:hypothetical protein
MIGRQDAPGHESIRELKLRAATDDRRNMMNAG